MCIRDRSYNGPLVFCGIPGRARRCFSDFVVPLVRSELVQEGWSSFYGELRLSVEVEIFNRSRDYEGLISVLGVERAVHILALGDMVNAYETVDEDEASSDNNDLIGDMIGSTDTYLIMSNPDDDRTVTDWYQIHGADFFWFEMSLSLIHI